MTDRRSNYPYAEAHGFFQRLGNFFLEAPFHIVEIIKKNDEITSGNLLDHLLEPMSLPYDLRATFSRDLSACRGAYLTLCYKGIPTLPFPATSPPNLPATV
jgi:hypothetical protein